MYTPTAGSLADRVTTWFRNNPEEELLRTDIARKFDCTPNTIDASLASALANRLIERSKCTESGATVFRAGANIDQAKRSLPASKTTARGGARTRLPVLDVSSVKINYGKRPPDPADCRRGANKYASLLERLDKAGASVELDIIYRGAIQKAVQKHAKDHPESGKKFLVRTIDDKTVGVWRTA